MESNPIVLLKLLYCLFVLRYVADAEKDILRTKSPLNCLPNEYRLLFENIKETDTYNRNVNKNCSDLCIQRGEIVVNQLNKTLTSLLAQIVVDGEEKIVAKFLPEMGYELRPKKTGKQSTSCICRVKIRGLYGSPVVKLTMDKMVKIVSKSTMKISDLNKFLDRVSKLPKFKNCVGDVDKNLAKLQYMHVLERRSGRNDESEEQRSMRLRNNEWEEKLCFTRKMNRMMVLAFLGVVLYFIMETSCSPLIIIPARQGQLLVAFLIWVEAVVYLFFSMKKN